MDEPTIDEVRQAKEQLRKQLKKHQDFAGIGIGRRRGRLVVQVNWRSLPADISALSQVGNVEVAHQEVGDVRAQPVQSPRK
jgi:hypothetical protein